MQFFNKLNQLVTEGKVNFTIIISLPRSNSTAFELALQQAHDEGHIQLGAPWHSKKYDDENPEEFDLGCKRIYDEIAKSLNPAAKTPINVLIKSHAAHLELPEFQNLLALSNKFAFSYRDPYSQFQSMITRMGNDLVEPGGNRLKFKEALQELEKQEKLEGCLGDTYSHWSHLIQQYRMVKGNASKKLIIQDGFTMRAFPEQSLKQACEVFGLSYTPKMISGWNDPTTAYTCLYTKDWGDLRLSNAWNGPAVNSTEIKPVDPKERHPKCKEIFPESCHHRLEAMIGFYNELARDCSQQSYNPTKVELDAFIEVSPIYAAAHSALNAQTTLIHQGYYDKREKPSKDEPKQVELKYN